MLICKDTETLVDAISTALRSEKSVGKTVDETIREVLSERLERWESKSYEVAFIRGERYTLPREVKNFIRELQQNVQQLTTYVNELRNDSKKSS
jgi:hypothetical protein